MTQQDDITQRLRDNADIDEAEHGNARVVQLERDAADEIERLRAELSKLRAPVADERAAGINPDECDAEVYERGTSVGLFAIPKEDANAICAGIAAATGARVDWHYIAGRVHIKALPALASAPVAEPRLEWSAKALYDAIKDVLLNHRLSNWVDEDGESFPLVDHLRSQDDKTTESGEFEIALICDAIYNDVLAKSAPVAGEAQEPVAVVGTDFDLYWAGSGPIAPIVKRHGLKVGSQLYAKPQASAENVRNAALEEAYEAVACLYAAHYQHGDLSALAALKEAGDDIRALKQPQADKDGGQWEPQTPEQIAADMRNMARSEGFDWPEPDGGQQRKRYVVLKASGSRYAYVNDTQEGRSINRFDILKGDGWKYAHEFADRMNKEHERAALSAPQAEQGERDA